MNKNEANSWVFTLYTAGQNPRGITAYANLRKLCEARVPGKYAIEVVDLVKSPHAARLDQVIAIPTLVRRSPQPTRKLIGDLSNTEMVSGVLGLPAPAKAG